MLKNDSFWDNDISQILSKVNLSPEMISSVKDFYNELDISRREMVELYKKTSDDKARRYDKQLEYMNNLYNKNIEYLIHISKKEDITPEEEEEISKKIAEKMTEAQKVFAEIIDKANEESDKETAKAQEETERSDKQKTESFGMTVAIISGAALVLAGTTVLIKNPKNLKIGVGLIGSGLSVLGVPVAKKFLPLLQPKDDVQPNDVIFNDD